MEGWIEGDAFLAFLSYRLREPERVLQLVGDRPCARGGRSSPGWSHVEESLWAAVGPCHVSDGAFMHTYPTSTPRRRSSRPSPSGDRGILLMLLPASCSCGLFGCG